MMLSQHRDRALIPFSGRGFRQAKRHTHFDLACTVQGHAENQVRVPADDSSEVAPQLRAQTQLLRP
ncbi:hypothetical protein IC63_00900 [Paracoccus sphaerophysae]|uniref:Uncharacterized protein n=1 Tax=Paracoccus sphaerophysae TaxID=690417 RepID=A0A099FI48_9RHOB|nr:hypothetical protein IC63_00900 [Paracoccus sphaerophysae]